MRLGLVSDTHGRFDAALPRLLEGSDLILHAGDVCGHEILHQLSSIAPVKAVRGNNDVGPFGVGLEETLLLHLGGLRAFLVHELLKPERPLPAVRAALAAQRPQLVVYGHSHQPAVRELGGILFVNPGSAGPRRFRLPRCAGTLELDGARVRVEVRDLDRPDLPLLVGPVEARLTPG